MVSLNSKPRSRKNNKNDGGKRVSRLALAAFILIVAVSENAKLFANARPFGEVEGKGAEMMVRALNATDLHQGTTQELLQELVDTLEKQQSEHHASRDQGYYGIHPLNRKRSNVESSEQQHEKRQGTLPQIVPAAAAAAASSAPASSSDPAPTSSAAPVTSASAPQPSSNSNSASPSASSNSAPTIQPVSKTDSSSKSSSSPSRSSSSKSPSPTQSDDSGSGEGVSSLFSTRNKLFPVAIILTVVMVLGVLLVLVSIGKFVSHRKMAQEKRDGRQKFSTRDNDYMIASAGKVDINRKRTLGRSIKRAFTRGRIGGSSFARREREGTVLIDVGDEVLAVTPEVAKEYERERKSCLSSYQSSVSNGGSRLTFPSNQPTPLRQALYNAQLIVAANEAEKNGGGRPVAPRGFDLNSWRRDSAFHSGSEGSYSEFDEKVLPGDRSSSNYGSKASLPLYGDVKNNYSDPSLQRSMSQRLADGLFALTTGTGEKQDPAGKLAFSFDSEMQMPGALRQAQLSSTVPILTRGGGGWTVQRQEGGGERNVIDFERSTRALQQRVPVKQTSDSTLRDSALSHERHTLRDQGFATAASGERRPAKAAVQVQANPNTVRPKSILIKDKQAHQQQQSRRSTAGAGAATANATTSKSEPQRRVTKIVTSSTAPGSPKMLQNRAEGGVKAGAAKRLPKSTSTGAGNGAATLPSNRKPIILNPEMPARGMTANGGQAAASAKTVKQERKPVQNGSANTRDLYRPLPLPPTFTSGNDRS